MEYTFKSCGYEYLCLKVTQGSTQGSVEPPRLLIRN